MGAWGAGSFENDTVQAEIVRTLSKKLRACYVFPDVAEQACQRLQKHLLDGDYAGITEGEFFAYALTVHMQEVTRDEHLWVRWHPEPLPEHEGSMLQNEEWVAELWQQARLDNYGLHKVERLPGNVGYLDIRYFYKPAWGSGERAAAAMSFLADMDALIVDLRQCRGGYPDMVALVSSYLFAEAVHLNSIYWRDEDLTRQYWTLPHVPGKRFDDKPIYVLVGQATFSGGEEFAYNLQTRQRAVLVGEATGGGAHPGSPHRLHPHFEAFIPSGRAINPITNDNWEGKGVAPDIRVPREEAFPAAYRLALESIVGSIGEPASGPLRLLLEEAKAALEEIKAPCRS